MATRFTRLSVVAGEQQLDASLPSTRPIAEFLADLPAMFGLSPERIPVVWALSTPRHGAIPPERCLDDVGVLDGDVLYLSAVTEAAESPFVEDVLGAIADTVDQRRPAWRDNYRDRAVTYLLTAVAVAGSLTLLQVPNRFLAGALLAAAGLGCLGLGRYLLAKDGIAIEWTVPWFAFLASIRLSEGQLRPTRIMAALAATLVGLAVMALVQRRVALIVVGAIGAASAGLAALLLSWGVDGSSIAAWSTPVFVLALGILPQLAMTTSGLIGLVQRGEEMGQVSRAELVRRTRSGSARLGGAIMALAGAGVVAVWAMVWAGRSGQVVLGLLLAAIVALRSRGFSAATHVGSLLAVPVTALVAAASAVPVWTDVTRPNTAVIERMIGLLMAFGFVAAAGYVRLSAPNAARLTRVLDLLDTVAVVALIPVLLLAQNVFGWLAAHL
jgi:type VII secretion integral membrane protein EccD